MGEMVGDGEMAAMSGVHLTPTPTNSAQSRPSLLTKASCSMNLLLSILN